ncbi:MAG: ethanolamine utilization protein EutN/carboxysome structural protein CcmL [uncultured bacterium]|nr:MAG: ethanolamine utilization protein EutN/carboxysome structural protein CcmL [uncultured bacterium]HLD44918.1 EutN/CcmL family microcompartment protein [bacterium]
MKLAKVIGTVVATVKDPGIQNLKILMIQPLDEQYRPDGGPIAAIDTVQAGPQEIVYYTLAKESTLALPNPFAPVDAAITGIVDELTVEDKGIANKQNIFEEVASAHLSSDGPKETK